MVTGCCWIAWVNGLMSQPGSSAGRHVMAGLVEDNATKPGDAAPGRYRQSEQHNRDHRDDDSVPRRAIGEWG
jgi:hypothetical protein